MQENFACQYFAGCYISQNQWQLLKYFNGITKIRQNVSNVILINIISNSTIY
jgi:hypothetical protein